MRINRPTREEAASIAERASLADIRGTLGNMAIFGEGAADLIDAILNSDELGPHLAAAVEEDNIITQRAASEIALLINRVRNQMIEDARDKYEESLTE